MPAHFDHGASGAERWMACSRSIEHLQKHPLPDTKFSKGGTSLHTLCENMWFKPDSLEEWDYSEDDWSAAKGYSSVIQSIVDDIWNEHKAKAIVVIEKQMSFDVDGVTVGGTPDCIIYVPGLVLHTVDLKGGFEEVDVVSNKQLLTYDAAACVEFDIQPKQLFHHIYQPNSLGSDWEMVEVPMQELWDFRQEVFASIVAERGTKKYVDGGHCSWCNKVQCPQWMKVQRETVGADLTRKDFEIPDISKFDTERLLRVKAASKLIKRMLGEVDSILHQRAMSGVKIPLHKLTAKLKNRAWIDEEKVVEKFGKKVEIVTKSVMSPAQVEKNFKEDVDDLVERKEDGYKLVPKASKGVEYIPDTGFGDEDLIEE